MPNASISAEVAEQFDDAGQQEAAAGLGMWVFLSTEVLFFGVLFTSFTVYRLLYAETFRAAGMHLNLLLGSLNTFVLLCSSFTMASALHFIQIGKPRLSAGLLAVTGILGALFIGLKFLEYYQHWQENLVPGPAFHFAGDRPWEAQLFYFLYFLMTGLHALHLLIGIAVVSVMARRTLRGKYHPQYHTPIEVTGLYWHFVDIVWVFLFPLFYLINRVH